MLIHYLQIIFGARSSQGGRVVKWSLLAKLDRLAIGSILRSKLVFLINVRLRIAFIEGACLHGQLRRQHSAECVDIDNESNQVP
jgi:hypothetical protein